MWIALTTPDTLRDFTHATIADYEKCVRVLKKCYREEEVGLRKHENKAYEVTFLRNG